ncbi:prepilin-type N-terminal cleavage/methylation domain-containing protein [Ideonella sp. DXS22W]|uniref:Prepilin-type N-terminal cleavage/methylation domain-containing protein n=1 Tax=Pseudaquabacterium inlustre TaxID=2984192 RepID=A0ABU9CIT8_9BURK
MLRHPRRRGVTIVELMVGVAVGLLVVAGALSLFVTHTVNSGVMLGKARMAQDLRAAADLVARDLRRAAYWGHAIDGTHAVGAGSAAPRNPYAAVSGSTSDGLRYAFTRDASENDTLDDAEQFGFRVYEGVLQMRTSASTWQDVTDRRAVRIADDGLRITATATTLPLGHLCARTCSAGTPNCPTTTVRRFDITLTGQSIADTSATRSVTATVRLRNDALAGQCPA